MGEQNSTPAPLTEAAKYWAWHGESGGKGEMVVRFEIAQTLEVQLAEAREVLARISSFLGFGFGHETTTIEDFEKQIREGIEFRAKALQDQLAESKSFRDETERQLQVSFGERIELAEQNEIRRQALNEIYLLCGIESDKRAEYIAKAVLALPHVGPRLVSREVLVEARRWFGGGDMSDDEGFYPSECTPAYIAAVELVDAELARTKGES